ncbi:MAG: right-handed parallel beta-helix repeat-containing protein [Deltaproteobacteria bacterium]|nr:right-handed parallel beta-helix repeat-containing protein [Deltaproteobacteria bacterium]
MVWRISGGGALWVVLLLGCAEAEPAGADGGTSRADTGSADARDATAPLDATSAGDATAPLDATTAGDATAPLDATTAGDATAPLDATSAADAATSLDAATATDATVPADAGPIPDCALPGVRCVDDTAGPTQEYATIQAAADAAGPGDSVLIFAGSYAGFQVDASGRANAPITFRAAEPGARIDRDGPSGDGIRLQNVSYVAIEGLEIQDVTDRCIAARGATPTSPMLGNVLRNNRCSRAGTECFYLSELGQSLVEGNVIGGCGAGGGSRNHGIYLANAGSDGTTLRGNTIAGATPSESNGVHINGDLSVGGDGVISGLVIEGNIIFDNFQNGLNMDGVQDSLIQNNLVFNNGRNAMRAYAIDGAAGPRDLRVVNNTFLAGGSGWALKISEDGGGHTVFNNILSGTSGSLAVETTNLASNNNALDGVLSADGEATTISLGGWQTATRQDAESSAASAASLLTADHRLAATSAAIDQGRPALGAVTAPPTDLEGNPRPRRRGFDLGAFEAP